VRCEQRDNINPGRTHTLGMGLVKLTLQVSITLTDISMLPVATHRVYDLVGGGEGVKVRSMYYYGNSA